MGEKRTKDEPKNPKIEKSTFVKIAISFPFLITCLIPPSEHRETTERRATEIRVIFFAKTCKIRRFARRKFAK